MSGYVTDTLGWLAGAFYVIVALSIVYLYFFRIVPLVMGTIKEWNIFVVVRVTIVLASLAFLIGCVAVITGDWIFSQVLDTLPRTRMAREIDRVTGSLVRLSVPGPIYSVSTDTGYSPGAAPNLGTGGNGASGPSTTQPDRVEPVSFPLKENALQLWMGDLQQRYNPTGLFTDNDDVMARRDIPQGVICDVSAAAGALNGWRFKRNEEWRLVCSMDGFRNRVTLTVNGTAARGLTGGGYYSTENPYTVYGEGVWPEIALDLSRPTVPAPAATEEGGPQSGALGSATPEAPATAANLANVHEVQRGESLALIAQQYQINVNSLVTANVQKYPQLSRNPNMIVVGWELTIPAE